MYIGIINLIPMRSLFFTCLSLIVSFVNAQNNNYTTSNAHSHNDYEQQRPFYAAFETGFGSIEADIHLVNGKVLVAHDAKNIDDKKTIESLYLIPLSNIEKIKKPLQLLIDIKTDARSTLDSLISILIRYPKIIQNNNIKIVISGNRPDEREYTNYPSYIWFDGRLEKKYTTEQLSKIALLSDDYGRFTMWKKTWPMLNSDREKIVSAIENAHTLKKPVRLWGSPDFPSAWDEMIKLKVDYINTDKIEELASYLKKK